MPTEDDLREQFREDGPPPGGIDLQAVLRGARARRRPRVAAAAIVSSLAVVGIVVPVSISLASTHSATSILSAGSAASASDRATAPEASSGGAGSGGAGSGGAASGPKFIKRAPANKINLCTGGLAAPAPADDGLVLTVQPGDAAAGDRDIPVTVTLTNTGQQPATGSLSPFPTVTLSRDGTVLWHSNGPVPSLAQQLDLAPGASTVFQASFEPVICGVEDDTRESFRADLPNVAPGNYQLSAALDFSPDDTGAAGQDAAVLVTGPTSPVTLH
ncbi:MAG: hypothetical protein ABIP33_09225 [Pseudolysinimonas sp.]